MDKYNLWLDGVSAEDIGIRLQGAVEISAAVPNVETFTIPGRNGDLHFYDGSYKNRTATVGAYVYRPDAVKTAFGSINEWLFGSFGYRKLVTDDDLDHFMLAIVSNGADVEARIRRIAPFKLKFSCKPQRFLNVGEDKIEITSNMFLDNPTVFSAKPLYRFIGSGSGKFTVGAYSIDIKELDGELWYDAETENAYKGTVNKNNTIYAPQGLPFEGGTQIINITGGIEKVEIVPRWWEL